MPTDKSIYLLTVFLLITNVTTSYSIIHSLSLIKQIDKKTQPFNADKKRTTKK